MGDGTGGWSEHKLLVLHSLKDIKQAVDEGNTGQRHLAKELVALRADHAELRTEFRAHKAKISGVLALAGALLAVAGVAVKLL